MQNYTDYRYVFPCLKCGIHFFPCHALFPSINYANNAIKIATFRKQTSVPNHRQPSLLGPFDCLLFGSLKSWRAITTTSQVIIPLFWERELMHCAQHGKHVSGRTPRSNVGKIWFAMYGWPLYCLTEGYVIHITPDMYGIPRSIWHGARNQFFTIWRKLLHKIHTMYVYMYVYVICFLELSSINVIVNDKH